MPPAGNPRYRVLLRRRDKEPLLIFASAHLTEATDYAVDSIDRQRQFLDASPATQGKPGWIIELVGGRSRVPLLTLEDPQGAEPC